MKLRIITVVTGVLCFLFLLSLVPAASVAAYSSTSAAVGISGTVSVGRVPVGAAFNPSNGLVFVADSGSNQLSVINSASSPKVVANVSTMGTTPWGATATGASCKNEIAVANSGSGTVSLINSAKPYGVVATVHIPSAVPTSSVSVPRGIAYASGNLYVADGAGQIDVINCSDHKLVEAVGLTPFSQLVSAFYDAKDKIVYFSDEGYGGVWYFDLSGKEPACLPPNPCLISTVGGNYTDAPAFFAQDNSGLVYYTDTTVNSIREIAIVNNTPVIESQQFGNYYSHEFNAPIGIAFDPQSRELIVSNSAGKNEITVLCISTYSAFCKGAGVGGFKQISNGADHGFGIVYDPTNGYLYVTNQNNASVSFLS
jgi:YVTN family beta-propeller protein